MANIQISDKIDNRISKLKISVNFYINEYLTILKNMGFTEINGGSPQKGDVYVEDQTKTHSDGHIAIYDGNNWVSDFVQKSDHVHAKDSGTNHYYRYSS